METNTSDNFKLLLLYADKSVSKGGFTIDEIMTFRICYEHASTCLLYEDYTKSISVSNDTITYEKALNALLNFFNISCLKGHYNLEETYTINLIIKNAISKIKK